MTYFVNVLDLIGLAIWLLVMVTFGLVFLVGYIKTKRRKRK